MDTQTRFFITRKNNIEANIANQTINARDIVITNDTHELIYVNDELEFYSVGWIGDEYKQIVDDLASDVETLQLTSLTPEQVTKLNGIEAKAEVNQNAYSTVKLNNSNIVSQRASDTLTINLNGPYIIDHNVMQNSVTHKSYIVSSTITLPQASTSTDGYMSSIDKTKLNGIEAQANKTIIDDTLTHLHEAADAKVTGDMLNNKVNKIEGMGLSQNSFTDAEKAKLASIEEGAEANVQPDWNAVSGDGAILNKPTIPTKTSDLTNDSDFQTGNEVTATINAALENFSSISYEIVEELPATGETGVIYLINNPHGESDIYDEYIYYNNNFEKIGSTEADLQGYVKTEDIDDTLSIQNKPADAKATGDAIAEINQYMPDLVPGIVDKATIEESIVGDDQNLWTLVGRTLRQLKQMETDLQNLLPARVGEATAGAAFVKTGEYGQFLRSNGDGTTSWAKLSICNLEDGVANGSLRGINTVKDYYNNANSYYNIGENAIALGYLTYASGECAVASGIGTKANQFYAHAEGEFSTAGGRSSHAEGQYTTASGKGSHAEGYTTIADGNFSHAEGEWTTANGTDSHVEGVGTIASSNYQHVFGKYNIEDSNNIYVEIVGNGTDDDDEERFNARTLDWSGNEKLSGSLTLGMDTQNETTVTAAQLKALLALSSAEGVTF